MTRVQDVDSFLEEYSSRTLLRFTTVGSVDDGKSTLIGRLLHETKNIFTDQLASLQGASKMNVGGAPIDYALVTDGLKAEREQGITIDVAYRYFSTPKRNFIIADTPGHVQYTRNMATGASTANVAIILIDAANGVLTQTRRHSFIASLLGIPRLLICVNKMDLVDYSQDAFDAIVEDYTNFATRLGIVDLKFIPISALAGDNVVKPSPKMPWHEGGSVLNYLETVYVGSDRNLVDFRFPVQYVIRPDANFRGFAGQIASGRIRKGEPVMILPSRRRSTVKSIVTFDGELEEAYPSQSVTITLEDEVDISRGDMIVRPNNVPMVEDHFEAMVVWMDETTMDTKRRYVIKLGTQEARVTVHQLRYCVDVDTLSRGESEGLELNEIGRVAFRSTKPLFFDAYRLNRLTGCFVLIDDATNATVAAGMIIQRNPSEELSTAEAAGKERNIHVHAGKVSGAERETRLGQRGLTFWFTGLSGSGKSTIAAAFERYLFDEGFLPYRLDGDNLRVGLNADLGFSRYDRRENIRRVSHVSKLFNDSGVVVLASLISPFIDERQAAREAVGTDRFVEVHVHAPLEVCEERDPKGLYKKARKGEIENFTGVTDEYEAPTNPQLSLDTSVLTVEQCVARLADEFDQRRNP